MADWGATGKDWQHFSDALRLTADMLPVVSNMDAEISEKSTLKELGKSPSLYNRKGKATGITGWTSKATTQDEVSDWSLNSDYGICLQTRRVRAIDVDVTDQKLANDIDDFIVDFLTRVLPKRYRANSSKFLLVFKLKEDCQQAKRQLIFDNGDLIEFLANGQQFVAAGTHQSGVRYEWENGLPLDIPEISTAEFDELWECLALVFEGRKVQGNASRNRDRSNLDANATDDVAEYLLNNWEVFSTGKGGELFIKCPFDSEHTSFNETSTAYYPENTGGFEQGHFKCLHAHCGGRKDEDFLDAVGYLDSFFDPITLEENKNGVLPSFDRDKNGLIIANLSNIKTAVDHVTTRNAKICTDVFRGEMMINYVGEDKWRSFRDEDYTRLRLHFENNDFKPITKNMIKDVVDMVAVDNEIDTAKQWIDGLKWDGVPRIENFFSKYMGAESSEYTKSVGMYLWTALAGRASSGGIKADMMPVLIGKQGCAKSSAVAAIAPNIDAFCEVSFTEKDDDTSRKLRGKLVGEIGELRGLHTKELESIKAFITRTHEHWVPKFKEFAVNFPRRLVFIGTTNKDEFLSDETGNRRFLPIEVHGFVDACNSEGEVIHILDVEGIKADRDQLWAEGKHYFEQNGIMFAKAEVLAVSEHDKYRITDDWELRVSNWLDEGDTLDDSAPRDRPYLTTNDVLTGAIGFELKNIGRREQVRASKIMQSLGYKKSSVRDGKGRVIKGFIKTGEIK